MAMRVGAYRAPLAEGVQVRKSELPHELRLALAAIPMTGVIVRTDLTEEVIACLEAVKHKWPEETAHYVGGLRSGGMIPVVPSSSHEYVWAPGELFFKS